MRSTRHPAGSKINSCCKLLTNRWQPIGGHQLMVNLENCAITRQVRCSHNGHLKLVLRVWLASLIRLPIVLMALNFRVWRSSQTNCLNRASTPAGRPKLWPSYERGRSRLHFPIVCSSRAGARQSLNAVLKRRTEKRSL